MSEKAERRGRAVKESRPFSPSLSIDCVAVNVGQKNFLSPDAEYPFCPKTKKNKTNKTATHDGQV